MTKTSNVIYSFMTHKGRTEMVGSVCANCSTTVSPDDVKCPECKHKLRHMSDEELESRLNDV